jgi:hypothetical protein
MPSFRTVLPDVDMPFRLDHHNRLLLLGSCFTENISNRLQIAKFTLLSRPFGTVYNPISIARCLSRLLQGDAVFTAGELFEHAGLWRNWDHHSDFAAPDAQEALLKINTAYRDAAAFIQSMDTLVITLGTADVHVLKKTGEVVANNHKMPSTLFDTRRMTPDETAGVLAAVFENLPDCRIVLTVSPVRHTRLGLHENQLSKAVLLLACDQLVRRFPNVVYFPAYEILLDDLRDYRFYAEDMIHPSALAVDYIWKTFGNAFFSPETMALVRDLERLHRAVNHRPFHPDTPEHRAFKAGQWAKVRALQAQYPFLNLAEEERYFGLVG